MANKNDERILQLKEQIKAKKEKIGKIGRFTAVTNLNLELDGQRFNLNVLDRGKLQQLLIKLNGFLMSAEALKLENVEFGGYTLQEWVADVKSKLEIHDKRLEERQLSYMEEKLEKMLSDEKQVELELDSIADLLKD